MAKKLIWATLLLGGCAATYDAPRVGAPQTEYSAIGQDPGWTLRIAGGRMAFAGAGARVEVGQPPAEARPAGRRYGTSRLVVDVVPGGCRDAMRGSGFEDGVTVSTAGRTLRGCGGARNEDREY